MKFSLIALLACMCGAALFASDVTLPAMPELAKAFQLEDRQAQYAISLYFLGLSLGQLIYGPLADRFGRRSVAFFGMTLFSVASLSCALAPIFPVLLVSRFFQALSVCSGLVIGRALIGDLFEKQRAAHMFTIVYALVGLSPAIGPVIGGLATTWWGWRAVFILAALLGLMILCLIKTQLPKSRVPVSMSNQVVIFKQIRTDLLGQYRFWAYAMVACGCYATYYAFVAQSPFMFHHAGYNSEQIGTFYVTLSFCYVAGNLFSKRLLHRYDIDFLLWLGFIFFNVGALSGIILTYNEFNHAYQIVLPLAILSIGNGFLLPLSAVSVINIAPTLAATASGLMGSMQLAFATMSIVFIGFFCQGSPFILFIYMSCITLSSGIQFFICFKKSSFRDANYSTE